MNDRSIRVCARCLFRHDGHILTITAQDPDKPEPHYGVPGGGVEFGETTENALRRELREELGAEVTGLTLSFVAEEIFEVAGSRYHEIVYVYEGRFVDPSYYARPSIRYVESAADGAEATWMPISAFLSGEKRIFPKRLVQVLTDDRGDPAH